MTGRVLQQAARLPVVAKVCESTRVRVQDVWPVRLGTARVEDCELDGVPGRAAVHAKPTLITHRKEPAQRVVPDVTGRATEVDAVDDKIGGCKLVEANRVLTFGHYTTSLLRMFLYRCL